METITHHDSKFRHLERDINGVPLLERVHSWITLEPEKIKEDFFYLRRSTPSDQIRPLLAELEVLYDRGQIRTPDFCLLIRITSSISTAVRILRTRVEPPILSAAVHVIRVHWNKTARSLKSVLSETPGSGGIIEILASLPSRIAERLLKAIAGHGGCKSGDRTRTEIVDSIIRASISFLNPDPNAEVPLRRLGFMVIRTIICAASPSLLRTLIPRLERDITDKTWRNLGLRRPKLVSELVFIQLDDKEGGLSTDNWARAGYLETPRKLFSAILAMSHQPSDVHGELGVPFLWKCLTRYVSHIQGSDSVHGDVFGLGPSLLTKLANTGLMSRLLREKGTGPEGNRFISQLVDMLKAIQAADRKEEWGWLDVYPVVDFVAKRFVLQKTKFTPTMPSQSSISHESGPTPTTVLQALFTHFRLPEISLSNPAPSFISTLEHLPTHCRFPFLAIVCLARFSLDITEINEPPPSFAASLLYLLDYSHGQKILRRGMDSHGNKFLSNPALGWNSRSTFKPLHTLFSIVIRSEIGTEHIGETQSALFRAAWIASGIKRFEDPLLPQVIKDMESVRQDVSSLKSLAARAQTGLERLAFLKIILSTVIHVQDLEFLNDILTWAAKRFVKDPEAGIGLWNWLVRDGEPMLTSVLAHPRPLRREPQGNEEVTSALSALRLYFVNAGKALRTLRMFRDLLSNEPGLTHQSTILWNDYGRLLDGVISERVDFASKLTEPLLQHSDIRGTLFEDLSPLILTHGPKGRDSIRPFPMQFHNRDIFIPGQLLHVIVPWLDDLGEKCEDLYLAALKAGDNVQPLPTRFWPLSITVPTLHGHKWRPHQDNSLFDFAVTHYYTRIETWLFDPPFASYVHLGNTFDPYRSPQRVLTYVVDYLDFSKDQTEVTQKAERLLEYYDIRVEAGSPSGGNQALNILSMPRFQAEIKRFRPLFSSFMDKLLPQYPSSDKDTQPTVFDPMSCLPTPIVHPDLVGDFNVWKYHRINCFTGIVEGVVRPNREIASLPGRTMERLAVFVVAWIATSLEIPHTQISRVQGPITYALKYVRLAKDFMNETLNPGVPWYYLDQFLEASLQYLGVQDLRTLVDVIMTLPMTSLSRSITVNLIRTLRLYHTPEIAVDLSLYILADTDSSSWHRQTLSGSLLFVVRPDTARFIMDRFIQLLEARMREQSRHGAAVTQREANDRTDPTATASQGDPGPLVKISTLKMFMEVLHFGVERGVFQEDAFQYIQQMMDISMHPSVLQVIITVIISMLRVADMLNAYGPPSEVKDDGMWVILRSFAQQGARLSEKILITDEIWGAVRCGDVPMPILENSHPIATLFLNTSLVAISPGTRERWIKDILVPLITGQTSNRTLWLRAAFHREGGSDEDVDQLEATYDDTFDAASILWQIINYFPDVLALSCIDELLPLIEQRLRTPFSRHICGKLKSLTQGNYKGREEEFKTYLTSVRLLTNHALFDDKPCFDAALSTINHAINSDTVPREGRERFVAVVQRLGESLLSPEYMLLSHDPRVQSPPFTLFLTMLRTFNPPMDHTTSSKWYERIRPILEGFLGYTIRLEQELSKKTHHGGAGYWPVIISLKVSLLPHPSVKPHALATDKVNTYGIALVDLAREVLSFPNHRVLFSAYLIDPIKSHLRCAFTDVIPLCKVLMSPVEADVDAGDIRVACVQISLELIDTFSTHFEGSAKERESRDEMMEAWSKDAHGVIRWMVMCHGNGSARSPPSVRSGRGGRGGRGR